jgi:spore coat polysaccharide biosynthesis predicted glycosyltransferase SpsG
LRKGFADVRRQLNSTPRIFVSFGGSDPPNVTQRAVAALADISGVEIDVVLGPANVNNAAIIAFVAAMRNVAVHIDPPDLARIMAASDVAVTAASGTMWELMALGTPVIAMAIVAGQKRNLDWLAENGVGRALGWHADVSDSAMGRAVRDCMNNPALRHTMAARGLDLVDACGADRVLDRMQSMVGVKA